MKRIFLLLFFVPFFAYAGSLYSPTWGFHLNLPEDYEFIDGDGKDRFSFTGPGGAMFDIVVYSNAYRSMRELVNDVNNRIANKGGIDFFKYRDKQAAVIELNFAEFSGWGICVELNGNASGGVPPMLLALAYSSANSDLNLFHLSALDSIVPSEEEKYYPGPIMEYSFPRGERKRVQISSGNVSAMVYENDAEAAQVLIEREFNILNYYISSGNWKEAWIRYYRMIYRDSFDRITDAASVIVRSWGGPPSGNEERSAFAQRALTYVQNFNYERDLSGSDFINLVTAVMEGRGDCDSRAMLFAVILAHADIRCAMMVSSQHSHAMGLVNLPGAGARFEAYGVNWLVAETTAKINMGLIAQDMSNPASWLGIIFE